MTTPFPQVLYTIVSVSVTVSSNATIRNEKTELQCKEWKNHFMNSLRVEYWTLMVTVCHFGPIFSISGTLQAKQPMGSISCWACVMCGVCT